MFVSRMQRLAKRIVHRSELRNAHVIFIGILKGKRSFTIIFIPHSIYRGLITQYHI